jgi:DNA adenine methylase
MVERYWNNFNIITKDHFYHSGGKIENRNSIVEALAFNFEANIIKHNYEPVKIEKQLVLFEKPQPSYYTEKLKDIINQ